METSKHFKCVDKKPISDGVIKRVPIKATLVVMPALLVQQWVTELAKHAPSLKVLVYEGPADTRGGKGAGICAKDLAEQDVVLMNFETRCTSRTEARRVRILYGAFVLNRP